MAARESAAVMFAAEAAIVDPKRSILSLAKQYEISPSSLRRALRARGVAPRTARGGAEHHAFIDGRTAVARPGSVGKPRPPARGSAAT
jgi:hypothetical protein